MLPVKLVALPLLLSFSVACDSSAKSESAADKKAAAAKAEEEETAKRIAARKEKRLAEEKAKQDAIDAKQAKVDAVCVLPEQVPKKLDKACAAVSDAHDAFMLRLYADKPEVIEKWNGGKKMQLDLTVGQCKKTGSLEVAACQANALTNATAEIKKEIPAIFKTCIDKFGSPPAPKPE
ncbi:MAG: hypothetical protein AAF721_41835 [Myxococcota bacterium]